MPLTNTTAYRWAKRQTFSSNTVLKFLPVRVIGRSPAEFLKCFSWLSAPVATVYQMAAAVAAVAAVRLFSESLTLTLSAAVRSLM
jgi:hypothetical protein